MKNKRFWLVILVMVLVFGMSIVSCDPDNGDTLYEEIEGTWEFTYNGRNYNVIISGNNWVLRYLIIEIDSGTLSRNGNTNSATLYSNNHNANIGTSTLTSNTTAIFTLHAPAQFIGTHNATKQQ